MEKHPFDDGRTIPMDDRGLIDMLSAGPDGIRHEVQPQIPSLPEEVISEPLVSSVVSPSSSVKENSSVKQPVLNEGPTASFSEEMILPSEAEKAALRSKYGTLRVVPIPYTRADGKIQTYILRQITRSQWRTMEDTARKVAESKPNVPPEEIFQEKIVSLACVWPNLPEHTIATSPAGLVPTLFGIVQQMSIFFDPGAIMSVTFVL